MELVSTTLRLKVAESELASVNGSYTCVSLTPPYFEQQKSLNSSHNEKFGIFLKHNRWHISRIDKSIIVDYYITNYNMNNTILDYFSMYPPSFGFIPVASIYDKCPNIVVIRKLEKNKISIPKNISLNKVTKKYESSPFISDINRLLKEIKSISCSNKNILKKSNKVLSIKKDNISYKSSINISKNIISEFWTNGAVCLRNVFDKNLIEKLKNKFDEIISNKDGPCSPFIEEYTPYGIDIEKKGRFIGINDSSRRISPFEKLVFETNAAEIAGKILNSNRIAFLFDHLFYKSAQTSTVTLWHRGQPDWCVKGNQLCSIWVPFDFVPKQTCLELIAGSHKWNDEIPEIDSCREKYNILSWNINPGDCIVFHGLTVHGAPANKLKYLCRHAMVMRFVGDDVKYDTSRMQVYPFYNFGCNQRQTYIPSLLKHNDYICKVNCDEIPVIWGRTKEDKKILEIQEYQRFIKSSKSIKSYKMNENNINNIKFILSLSLNKNNLEKYICYLQLYNKAKINNNKNKINYYKNIMDKIILN